MSGLVTTGEKNLVLVSGRAHMDLAHAVGEEIGCGVSPVTAYDFASGEIYVRFNESVRGADVFVLQSIAGDINKWLMEQLIMIDAAKRASAKRITVVAPFYPYSRQDKKHQGREPISARLMADLYRTAGADRIMSVDLHASQEQGFFDGPVDHLFAMPVLVDYVRGRVDLSNTAVVSPDAGRIRVAEKWSKKLGGAPLAFVHKTRDTTRPNVAVANRVVGEVAGKECVLVDDMIDTAGTITEAINVLNNAGAKRSSRRHARHPLRSCREAPLRIWRGRGRRHRHAADSRREALRAAHRPVYRAAPGSCDSRGLRRRFGHIAV